MHPIAELSQIAREFHHLQGEHAREGVSSGRHRRQRARMEELEEKYETLLVRWVPGVAEQARWREHFYRGAEAPADLLPEHPAPLFRGRSELGITLVIRATESEQELLLEGAVVDRLPLRNPITSPVLYGDSEFHELFEVAPDALEALLDYVERRADEPPWARARELYDEGLIDENFGLTARGRRYRDTRRR